MRRSGKEEHRREEERQPALRFHPQLLAEKQYVKMAEGGNKRLLCRFFSNGYCREGDNCQFSHDREQAIPVPENVCWYYLQGKCSFDDKCRFIHQDAGRPSTSEESSQYLSEAAPTSETVESSPSSTPSTSHYQEIIEPIPDKVNSSFSCYLPTNPCSISVLCDYNNDDVTSVRQPSEDSGYGEQALSESEILQVTSTSGSCSTQQLSEAPPKSYADALKDKQEIQEDLADVPLCPFAIQAMECVYGENCEFLHGNRCELCNCLSLHPHNAQQRKQHHEECVKEHERQMELSFAVKRSLDKACGICMDIIMEKEPPTERRFGILEKCSHIFCLNCIRKWRQTKQFDNKTIRACPECRVASDFVIPNQYWVDTPEEKNRLIDNYKKNLSQKPCKYFKQGRGECPFAGACFYLHAYPDGTKAEMPPPRARRRQAQDGELETIRDMLLWNYLEAREDRQFLLTLDLEDMMDMHEMGFFSDETDDDTDYTDYLLD